jgi:hypothetical protein
VRVSIPKRAPMTTTKTGFKFNIMEKTEMGIILMQITPRLMETNIMTPMIAFWRIAD